MGHKLTAIKAIEYFVARFPRNHDLRYRSEI